MIGKTIFTISTHTPLAGRDQVYAMDADIERISTHTPLAGRDLNTVVLLRSRIFLLTRPSRGATWSSITDYGKA